MANKCSVPPAGLAMIRFHSAYPWHTGGAYREFMQEGDFDMLKWVLEFNKFDLYTKDDSSAESFDAEKLWPYYQTIIDKYFPQSELVW